MPVPPPPPNSEPCATTTIDGTLILDGDLTCECDITVNGLIIPKSSRVTNVYNRRNS